MSYWNRDSSIGISSCWEQGSVNSVVIDINRDSGKPISNTLLMTEICDVIWMQEWFLNAFQLPIRAADPAGVIDN